MLGTLSPPVPPPTADLGECWRRYRAARARAARAWRALKASGLEERRETWDDDDRREFILFDRVISDLNREWGDAAAAMRRAIRRRRRGR